MRHENYSDMVARLFPAEDVGEGINSKRVKTVTMQVTEDCNLCCSYCYQGAKTKQKMTFETAKKVIDMLLASDERTNKYITCDKIAGIIFDFIGGEPFLEVELIDRIMDYFVKEAYLLRHPLATRYKIAISTNGTLYFTQKVQDFLNKWGNKLSLGISIDGNEKLHDSCRVFPDGSGSYALAIKAAKDYMSRGNYVGSKMTIAPGNVSYLCEAVKGLLSVGYKEIYLNCVYEEGWTTEHAKMLYQQLKELADYVLEMDEQPYIAMFDSWIGKPLPEHENGNWCGGTGQMLAVDWKGDFYPCIRYMGSSLNGEQEPYAIGDLESGIMNKQLHRERVELLEKITRKSQSTRECFECPIAAGCSWCSGYNYQKAGTPDKRLTYICVMHKARVLANVYYWNKLFRKGNDPQRYAMHIPESWAKEIIGQEEYEKLKQLAKE